MRKRRDLSAKRRRRRLQILLQAVLVVAFVFVPTYAGGGGGGGGGGGKGGGGGGGGGGGCSGSQYLPDEVNETFADQEPPITDLSAISYSESIDSDGYMERLLSGASNRFDARLPGYSYFQGVAQAYHHILVAGQVRVVGGVLGADVTDATGSFYQGAMVTTNAQAFFGAGQGLTGGPPGVPTRIRSWRIVPEDE